MAIKQWPYIAVLCSACTSSEPRRLDAEGDPCNSPYTACVDDESALSCEDRIWTVRSCDELCSRLGPSYVADGCDGDCVCVPADPTACTPGQTSCIDDATLATCDEDQQTEALTCETVCATQGLASSGCLPAVELSPGIIDPATCWCTHEGTPCDDAALPSCVDASTLARCSDGAWLFEPCASLCGRADAACDPWAQPAACAC
jgi:hypothetical protein